MVSHITCLAVTTNAMVELERLAMQTPYQIQIGGMPLESFVEPETGEPGPVEPDWEEDDDDIDDEDTVPFEW